MPYKIIAEFPDYEINRRGRVRRRVDSGRSKIGTVLIPKLHSGTPYVSLNKTVRQVAKLVAIAFIGQPSSQHELIFIDNNRKNVCVDNLKWHLPKQQAAKSNVWKTVKEFPDYQVNEYGQIRIKTTKIIRKEAFDKDGYSFIVFGKKWCSL